MENEKQKTVSRLLHFIFRLMLLAFYVVLLLYPISCGRRGDPVAISPYEEKHIEKDVPEEVDVDTVSRDITVKEEKATAEDVDVEVAQPDAPSGLIAVHTESGIVLTWDEPVKQDVQLYRIYRSTGDGYELAGSTVTPAFTDRSVKLHMKYYYKVTAVGRSESPASEAIEIITEKQ